MGEGWGEGVIIYIVMPAQAGIRPDPRFRGGNKKELFVPLWNVVDLLEICPSEKAYAIAVRFPRFISKGALVIIGKFFSVFSYSFDIIGNVTIAKCGG